MLSTQEPAPGMSSLYCSLCAAMNRYAIHKQTLELTIHYVFYVFSSTQHHSTYNPAPRLLVMSVVVFPNMLQMDRLCLQYNCLHVNQYETCKDLQPRYRL